VSSVSVRELYQRARQTSVPLLGGHRGNPAQHPENTLASFRSALELGVDVVECDVHLSADRELVVIHDHTLERTTNGTGLVGERTLAELRQLDAGGGERIPTLAQVCELVRGRAALAVELKQLPIPYPDLEERVVACLREQDMVDSTTVISFRHASMRRIKELEPGLVVGLLDCAHPIDVAGLMRSALADAWCPHWGAADAELAEEVHRAGGVVGVWTVDEEPALAWARLCGADAIFTNRPAEFVSRVL
jgi:glycerophosphoryl diester phosphodiesterase